MSYFLPNNNISVIGNVQEFRADYSKLGYTLVDGEYYYYSGKKLSDFFASDILLVKDGELSKTYKEYWPIYIPLTVNRGFPTSSTNTPTFFNNRFQFHLITTSWTSLNQIFIKIPLQAKVFNMAPNTANGYLPSINLNQWPQIPWIIAQMISQIQIKINDAVITGLEDINDIPDDPLIMNSLLNTYKKEDMDIIAKIGLPFQNGNSWGMIRTNTMNSSTDVMSISDPKWKLSNVFNVGNEDFRLLPLYFFSNFFNRSTFLPPGSKIEIDVSIQNIYQQLDCCNLTSPIIDDSFYPGYIYGGTTFFPSEDLTQRNRGINLQLAQNPSIVFYEEQFTKDIESQIMASFLKNGFLINTVGLKCERFFNNANINSSGFLLTPNQTKYENVILNISSTAPEYILFILTKPWQYSLNKDQNSAYLKPFNNNKAFINVPSFTNKTTTRLCEMMPFSFRYIQVAMNGVLMDSYSQMITDGSSALLRHIIERETSKFFLEDESVVPVAYYNTKHFCGSFLPIKITNLNPQINRNITNTQLTRQQVNLAFEIVDLNNNPFTEPLQLKAYIIERKQYKLTGNQIIINTLPATQNNGIQTIKTTWLKD